MTGDSTVYYSYSVQELIMSGDYTVYYIIVYRS